MSRRQEEDRQWASRRRRRPGNRADTCKRRLLVAASSLQPRPRSPKAEYRHNQLGRAPRCTFFRSHEDIPGHPTAAETVIASHHPGYATTETGREHLGAPPHQAANIAPRRALCR